MFYALLASVPTVTYRISKHSNPDTLKLCHLKQPDLVILLKIKCKIQVRQSGIKCINKLLHYGRRNKHVSPAKRQA